MAYRTPVEAVKALVHVSPVQDLRPPACAHALAGVSMCRSRVVLRCTCVCVRVCGRARVGGCVRACACARTGRNRCRVADRGGRVGAGRGRGGAVLVPAWKKLPPPTNTLTRTTCGTSPPHTPTPPPKPQPRERRMSRASRCDRTCCAWACDHGGGPVLNIVYACSKGGTFQASATTLE